MKAVKINKKRMVFPIKVLCANLSAPLGPNRQSTVTVLKKHDQSEMRVGKTLPAMKSLLFSSRQRSME
jgi:hypothetical protein